MKLETIGAVADELAHLHLLGLPDDYDDGYKKELGAVTPERGARGGRRRTCAAGTRSSWSPGTPRVIGPMLSHFGQVKVVDPTRDFARIRSIPADPSAPLEVPRQEGR